MATNRKEKSELRAHMRAKLRETPPMQLRELSGAIDRRLRELPAWQHASTILVFLSMPGEFISTPTIEAALSDGKTVGVPRMHGGHIRFHRIASVAGPWELHPYGIREPRADAPVIDVSTNGPTLVVTPGCAFDRSGGRMGYGKGFYDRFMSECRNGSGNVLFVAVCFDFQVVDSVPMGDLDLRPDSILTERGVIYPAGGAPDFETL